MIKNLENEQSDVVAIQEKTTSEQIKEEVLESNIENYNCPEITFLTQMKKSCYTEQEGEVFIPKSRVKGIVKPIRFSLDGINYQDKNVFCASRCATCNSA